MNLIKVAIHKEDLDVDLYQSLSETEENRLLKLCLKHSIGIIAGDVLGKSNQIEKTNVVKKLMNEAFMSVIRYEQLQRDKENITKEFDKLQISYIVLKGPRVRKYYPKPWLRTSCDIDILVHEDDIDKAVDGLVEKCSFEKQGRNYHDIPLISPNDVLLELHFNIKENMDNLDRVLVKVWENSSPVDNKESAEYVQSNEFFIFHLLAHMAYHFQHGGCGIRSVLDIYLIYKQIKYDEKQLRKFCSDAGIETFYEYIIKLSEVWFGNGAHTQITLAMEEYILHGGAYGAQDSNIVMEQTKHGKSHSKYIYRRIFMSYENLKIKYPILEKNKYLTPVFQVVRWIKMISDGKLKRYTTEFHVSKTVSREKLDSTEKLLKALKLN